ncbi:hypothetical protein [Oleiharenicola lentus]|uniref:hypothetical protein n=1 Tax=Oleiharenicola lentus TaxID=2508720 RepID=UPI003F66ADB3
MKILVIEDSQIKFNLIRGFVAEKYPHATVIRGDSYNSGIIALHEASYDIVLLDMTLSVYDSKHGGIAIEDMTFGGEEILKEARRKKIPAKFIVITQYDAFPRNEKEVSFTELSAELKKEFPSLVLGCVRLDASSTNWKQEISNFLTTS